MLNRHTPHQLTALAGAAVLAAGLLVGAVIPAPRPAAAQGPLQAPDLTVTLTAGLAAVQPQAETKVEATVRFRNGPIGLVPQYANGPVEFEVQLPAGSTVWNVTHSRPLGGFFPPCSYPNATTVRCLIAQLSHQDPVTTTVSALAPAALGTHTATARVDTRNTVRELVEGNNTATTTIRVRPLLSLADADAIVNPDVRNSLSRAVLGEARPVLRLPDLTIRRVSAAQQHITGGQTADIEFEVENLGSSNAQGVIVRSQVPQSLGIQSANLSGNACSVAGHTWTCTLDLPAGGGPVRLGMAVTPLLVVVGQSVIHTIAAAIDPANAFFETDESNNAASASVIVP